MTKTPKIRSFSIKAVLYFFLFFPPIGILFIVTFFHLDLWKYIIYILLIILAILFYFRFRFLEHKASVQLHQEDLRERSNLIELEIKKEEQNIYAFKEKIKNYLELKSFTEKLLACLSTETTLKTLSDEVNKVFGINETTVVLYLMNQKSHELSLLFSFRNKIATPIKSKQGDSFDHWVFKKMQSLLIEDIKSDYRFDLDKIDTKDSRTIRSLVAVPIVHGHKSLGVIRLDHPEPLKFKMEDLRFLTTIADLGAVAIENAHLYEQIEELAVKDNLTGLFLRRYLLERMAEEVGRQLRQRGQVSFLMIDIDKFKNYNDQFGHMAGDIVLKTVGQILEDYFTRPGDLVSRYGGEEFAVLLPDCPRKKAVEIAEEIRNLIAQKLIILRREKINITVSIGVAELPMDASVKDELISKADQAMYKAKNSGRNKVCVL